MHEIEARFNAAFSNWGIRLPSDAVAKRKRGKIIQAGWTIWYLFDSNEKGEYLDYYASHRMTEDEHVRMHFNGKSELLPTVITFRLASQDPKEDACLEAEHVEKNRRILEMLKAKGFGLEGDEPGHIGVKRYLTTNSRNRFDSR
jgi:hypothetical protein